MPRKGHSQRLQPAHGIWDTFYRKFAVFHNNIHSKKVMKKKKQKIRGRIRPCITYLSSRHVTTGWGYFFSAPELRMSYCDHFLSVVRPCVRPLTFSNDFSPKLLSQFCANFIWSLLKLGEWTIAKMVAVRWPRWPPRPYIVKTFKNLLLQNPECLMAESLHKSSGTRGLPKSLK